MPHMVVAAVLLPAPADFAAAAHGCKGSPLLLLISSRRSTEYKKKKWPEIRFVGWK
jgi:hypothetical protein